MFHRAVQFGTNSSRPSAIQVGAYLLAAPVGHPASSGISLSLSKSASADSCNPRACR